MVQNKKKSKSSFEASSTLTTSQFFYEESLNILTSLKEYFFARKLPAPTFLKKKGFRLHNTTNVPAPCKFRICDNNIEAEKVLNRGGNVTQADCLEITVAEQKAVCQWINKFAVSLMLNAIWLILFVINWTCKH